MGDTTSIGFDTIPITFWLKYRGIDYPNDYFLQFFSGEQPPPPPPPPVAKNISVSVPF